nr:uncharacterized protein CI109_005064 [Kwoniella shandongensis]KAA5526492.1 hypothetical protein CI109_005064 [Kwoniella shandongensis]
MAGTIGMCAIPQVDKPIRFFDVAHHVKNPRGSSIVSDSLLLSLLAVAAVHRSAIFSQQGKGLISSQPVGKRGKPPMPPFTPTSNTIKRLKDIATHFSNSAIEMSRTAMVVKLSDDDSLSDHAVIYVLESLVSSLISQSMLGGTHWKDAFDIALGIIRMKGGPERMLEMAKQTSDEALTKIRASLEDLAFVDTVVCLSTGIRPRLLVEPFQPWWFDYAPNNGRGAMNDFHYAYGLDRGLLELANRVNMLVYERDILVSLSSREHTAIHDTKVRDILLELVIWESGIDQSKELTRVEVGNIVMIHVIRVTIYVQLLQYPHSHPSVQSSALVGLRVLDNAEGFVMSLLVPKIIFGK